MKWNVKRVVRRLAAAAGASLTVLALTTGVARADIVGPMPPLLCDRSVEIHDRRGYEGDHTGEYRFPTLFSFTVSSTCNRGGTVSYQTLHSTTDSFDYTSTSGTLSFEAGDTSAKTVHVWVTRDNWPGSDERFWVKLSSPSSGITIADAWAAGTIINDDGDACVPPPDLPPGADWHCME